MTTVFQAPPAFEFLDPYATYDRLSARAKSEGKTVGPLYEDIVLGLYASLLQPGDVTVDLGAHDGHHTFPMSSLVGPEGRVYAIEAIDQVYMKLLQHVVRAKRTNVVAMNFAASNRAGEADFTYYSKIPGYSGLRPAKLPHTADELGEQTVRVQCATLDDIIPRCGRVRFIKMDIEGGEFHALQGARNLIAADRPVIALENGLDRTAEQYGYSQEDFLGFFKAMDYQLYFISGHAVTPDYWVRINRPHFFELVAIPMEQAGLLPWLQYIARMRAEGPVVLEDWRGRALAQDRL